MLEITVIGNIGQDAKVLENGVNKSIVFSVASTKIYKNKDGNTVQNTIWVKCYGNFEHLEKLMEYLKKGTKVYATGSMSLHQWKNEKTKKLEVDVRCYVEKIQLLDSKKKYSKELEEKFDLILQAAKNNKTFADSIQKEINQLIKPTETKQAPKIEQNKQIDELVDEETGEIIEIPQEQDDLPF